jgi:hypothetical protein
MKQNEEIMGGLMAQGQGPEMTEDEESEGSSKEIEVDSDLVYRLAVKLLDSPEGAQNVSRTLQGAKDLPTAIGKMAGVLIAKIMDELESRDMPVSSASVFGEKGSLAKVLTAIYQAAAKSGVEVSMEDTIIPAYEVAEADLEMMEQQYGG